MKCDKQPVFRALINNKRDIVICSECLNQLKLKEVNISIPLNNEPEKHATCECDGCGLH